MISMKKTVEGQEKIVEFHPIDVKDALADGWVRLDAPEPEPEPAPAENGGTPPYQKNKGKKDDKAPAESISGT